jgi:hypothetical protein
MKSGYTLDKIKKAKIQASIASFFESEKLGGDIEESDIVNWLTTDVNTKSYIEYIALPFDAFYIPEDSSAEITNTRTSTILSIDDTAYAVLNKCNISEII